MASVLSTTELTPILKELFADDLDQDLIYKDHPLMGMLRHDRKFGGRFKRIPIRYGKPVGVGGTYAGAAANAATSLYSAFEVTRAKHYGVCKFDGDAVDLAKTGDDSIFIEDVEAEISGLLSSMGDSLAMKMYRGTSGSRARVGSGTSSPITLANPEDIYFFEVGMKITANDTDDTTTPRSGTGTITNIDEDAGTITYTGTITSLAVSDYLFVSTEEGVGYAGLEAWCPAAAPTSTLFFGVDRSTSTRLGGIRFNGASFGHEELFINLNARLARSNAKPDYYFMNPKDIGNFEKAASGQREHVGTEYNMGYEAIRAYNTKFIADPDCPVGVAWGLPMSCFWWSTLGDAPRVINEDGLEFLRSTTADEYELRMVAKGNTMSDSPGQIVRVTLPS